MNLLLLLNIEKVRHFLMILVYVFIPTAQTWVWALTQDQLIKYQRTRIGYLAVWHVPFISTNYAYLRKIWPSFQFCIWYLGWNQVFWYSHRHKLCIHYWGYLIVNFVQDKNFTSKFVIKLSMYSMNLQFDCFSMIFWL